MCLLVGGAHTRVIQQVSCLRRSGDGNESGDGHGEDCERFESIGDANQRVEPESSHMPAQASSKQCDRRYTAPSLGFTISRKHLSHGDTEGAEPPTYAASGRWISQPGESSGRPCSRNNSAELLRH